MIVHKQEWACEDVSDRVQVLEERLLSDHWYVLKTTRLAFRRSDGSWQTLQRETYDRGNGAVVLLVDRGRAVVRLVRQFRYPAHVNGYKGLLIEAPAGLLDKADPEARIRAEAEEEAGVRITAIRPVFEAYMSPGSVTEKLHFFVAEYAPQDVVSTGGGLREEGEDIDVIELPFTDALLAVDRGEIVDAKTMLLLYWAREHVFGPAATCAGPLLVLIAGPYRSGTDDDPLRIAQNMAAMTATALQVAALGHVPVLGEWLALPLIHAAGSTAVGDATFDRYFHSTARQLVTRCDACLRIGGPSRGADEMVQLARTHGRPVYTAVEQLPTLLA